MMMMYVCMCVCMYVCHSEVTDPRPAEARVLGWWYVGDDDDDADEETTILKLARDLVRYVCM